MNGKPAEDFGFEAGDGGEIRRIAVTDQGGSYFWRDPDERFTAFRPVTVISPWATTATIVYDSRYWGPVPEENLVGRGLVRLLAVQFRTGDSFVRRTQCLSSRAASLSAAGLCGGYLLVLFFNPIRLALRDGFRCLMRFKRIWLTFVLLGFAYSIFQFATFTPLQARPISISARSLAPGSLELAALCRRLAETSASRAGRRGGNFR